MNLRHHLIIGTAALSIAACGTEDTTDDANPGETPEAAEVIGKETGKEDAWDARNDPARLANFVQVSLEYDLFKLPKKGEAAQIPWPDTYWPTYMDSANVRWQLTGNTQPTVDDLSPLEKYDVAFNGWELTPDFLTLRPYDPKNCEAGFDLEYYTSLGPAARWMSTNKGNRPARDKVYRNGAGSEPVCDQETKDAVETWWGLCHAWAPASIIEPEPLYPVELNGVTFEVADIKALIQTVYDSSNSMILGGRCNAKEVDRDEFGRIKADECRDTNAGSFHVIMSNFLGRYNMSLLEDRTFNYEVWNQPIRSFEVTQMEELDLAGAQKLLGLPAEEGYRYNRDAKRFVEVYATIKYITESNAERRSLVGEIDRFTRTDNYHYLLELDAEGVIIGGEWLQGRGGNTRWGISEQPDFLWVTSGPNTSSFRRSNPHVDYAKVKELIKLSRQAPQDDNGEDRVFGNDTVVEIPDNDATGVTSTITLPETITAEKVSVQIDIKHTYIGDLIIKITDDAGNSHTLHNREGGSADDINKVYDVSGLAGNLTGTYTLHIADRARIDTGKLVQWAIIAH